MKQLIVLAATFMFCAGLLFAQEVMETGPDQGNSEQSKGSDQIATSPTFDVPVFVLATGFSTGYLITGIQQEFLDSGFSTKPTDQFLSLVGDIKLFPVENLGIELGVNALGLTFAQRAGRGNFYAYNSTTIKLGLEGRVFLVKKPKFGLSLNLSAGANYSLVQYDNNFSSILNQELQSMYPGQGVALYNLNNSFGYYAKFGVQAYLFKFLYAGVSAEYFYHATTVASPAATTFDAGYLNFPIEIGIYVF